MEEKDKSNIIIYQSEDGQTHIEVRMDEDTVWLTQQQICELFDKSKSTISEHIKNVFEEGELQRDSVVRKSEQLPQMGNHTRPCITIWT